MNRLSTPMSMTELEMESYDIQEKFGEILLNLEDYLKADTSRLYELSLLIETFQRKPTIYEKSIDPAVVSDKFLKENPVSYFMTVIANHSSFFNYTILDKVICRLNYNHGKHLIDNYKQDFNSYLRNGRIIPFREHSEGILQASHETIKIELDTSFLLCRKLYLKKLQENICAILKVDKVVLLLNGVQLKSVHVHFHLPEQLVCSVFPLSNEQLLLLSNLKYETAMLIRLECQSFNYFLKGNNLIHKLQAYHMYFIL